MLIFLGTVTGALFLVWWGNRLRYEPPAYRVAFEEEGYGRGDRPAGFGRDEKAPGDRIFRLSKNLPEAKYSMPGNPRP